MNSNKNKNIAINTSTGIYARYALKTHFVKAEESYDELIEKYVLPVYEDGDIISSSEKVVALCQNRIIKRENIHISNIAKILSKFASHPKCGIGVGETIKMQYAIDSAGLCKVLIASAASAVTKLFGKKGIFYKIVGQDVSGLDGFYDHVWDEYRDIGILLPSEPSDVCNKIRQKYGVSMMIVDANDIGQEILGKSSDIKMSDSQLVEIIRDNPAGQGRQCTPFIVIRKKTA